MNDSDKITAELMALADAMTLEAVKAHMRAASTGIPGLGAFDDRRRALEQAIAGLEAQLEVRDELLHKLLQWAQAYPLAVFPKPDLKKAHEVLTDNGMTLDSISADAMRHVISQVERMIDSAMRKEPA